MDTIDKFHQHMDECKRCRENPFNLCSVGHSLLIEATKPAVLMQTITGKRGKGDMRRKKK